MRTAVPTGVDFQTEPRMERLGREHRDHEQALCVALATPDGSDGRSAAGGHCLRSFLRAVEQQGLGIDLVMSATVNGRMTAASAVIESPGRNALVYLGYPGPQRAPSLVGTALLRSVQTHAWRRDLVLLQALLNPGDVSLASTYRDAGFRYLAELVYQDARGNPVPGRRVDPAGLRYFTYSADRHSAFVHALDASYEGSFDCAALKGLRDTADVLLGHRHTGLFDPQLWFLATRQERPVGILLMSVVIGRAMLEIVYMGVAAEARGQGVGDALLSTAIEVARRRQTGLTLAVDSTNVYARKLYERWGFAEVGRRRAWIVHRPR